MAAELVEVVVWVMVDEDGSAVASDDGDTLHERYDDMVGGDRDLLNLRRIKVVLQVPKPAALVMTGTVPAEPEGGELATA
jgi:hypothetical protein